MPKPDIVIISPTYANFVKDPAEAMAPCFGKMSVIVTHNPMADISDYLPLDTLKLFAWKARVDVTGKPDNVEVIPARTLYLPTDGMFRKLPRYCCRTVEKVLAKRRIDFDLIHSHFASPQGYVGVRLKEKYGVPAVITVHGYDIYDLPYRSEEWRDIIASTLDAADHIVTVSHSNLRHIRKLDVKTPVSVIPNGFRADLFYTEDRDACRKALGIPVDRKVVLTVGVLTDVKGHEYLVRAMRKVADVDGNALCIIVGQGGLRGTLQRLIGRLGLEGKVVLAGPKPHDELHRWINAADVFVLPSLIEGNPTVMFECLGCGKPFVGTRVGGIPEHITGEEIGYLSWSPAARSSWQRQSWRPWIKPGTMPGYASIRTGTRGMPSQRSTSGSTAGT